MAVRTAAWLRRACFCGRFDGLSCNSTSTVFETVWSRIKIILELASKQPALVKHRMQVSPEEFLMKRHKSQHRQGNARHRETTLVVQQLAAALDEAAQTDSSYQWCHTSRKGRPHSRLLTLHSRRVNIRGLAMIGQNHRDGQSPKDGPMKEAPLSGQ